LHGRTAEPILTGSSVTIGNYDGVHRGHQAIISRARIAAETASPGPVPSVVLTFEPHPLTVIAPAKAPPRLTPLPEKLDRLAAAGADVVVVAEANRDLLGSSPQRFIEGLVARLHPVHVVEGASFRFGRGRSGSPATLQELGHRYGFEVSIVEAVCVQVAPNEKVEVSSSIIRRFVASGEIDRAAACLGRRYALIGTVVGGIGRGRELGFPTANVAVPDQLVPGDGVYAGFAEVAPEPIGRSTRRPAAISIGTTPTFGETGLRRIEAHLLDCRGDLYGRAIRLEFGRRLRGQERFDSPAGLTTQIERDVEAVRRYAAAVAAADHSKEAGP